MLTIVKDVVVDTSALVAVATREPGLDWALDALYGSERRLISAASAVELSVVLTHRIGPTGPAIARSIIRDGEMDVVPLDIRQAELASRGFVRFGKDRHPASLTFGDCFVYGLAASLGLPIVCLGNDFPQTDLETISPN